MLYAPVLLNIWFEECRDCSGRRDKAKRQHHGAAGQIRVYADPFDLTANIFPDFKYLWLAR